MNLAWSGCPAADLALIVIEHGTRRVHLAGITAPGRRMDPICEKMVGTLRRELLIAA